MGGTREGGHQAAKQNKLRHGNDFYRKIGAKGGRISKRGGFGQGEEGRKRARIAGAIGGSISRRTKASI